MPTQNQVKPPSIIRDDEFYYETATFLVEDRLFKVPVLHLIEESEVFRTMFELPQNPTSEMEGLSDERPIALEGVKKQEFKDLLRVIYSRVYKKEVFIKEQWNSVLVLSSKWDMGRLRELAINNMTPVLSNDPQELVLWGRKFDVDAWLFRGIEGLIDREDPMNEKDANVLGVSFALKIAATREKLHAIASDKYKAKSRYPGKVSADIQKYKENLLQTEYGFASNKDAEEAVKASPI